MIFFFFWDELHYYTIELVKKPTVVLVGISEASWFSISPSLFSMAFNLPSLNSFSDRACLYSNEKAMQRSIIDHYKMTTESCLERRAKCEADLMRFEARLVPPV